MEHIALFEEFCTESANPIRDMETMSPSEILINLTNWVGGVSGDNKDFVRGLKILRKRKDDLTPDQKQTLMSTLDKLDDKYRDRFLPWFIVEIESQDYDEWKPGMTIKWKTIGGNSHMGTIKERDDEVLIVDCDDGQTRCVDLS